MYLSSYRVALLTGAAAMTVAFAGAAQAQTRTGTDQGSPPAATANAQPADPAANPGTDSEPEIIVTATKRSERLQDVPASVSVVTATNLAQEGAVRFQDYAGRIPGVSLTSARTGNTQVTLRGITTGASQPGSTTAFYVDEAPFGSVNAYTGGNGITPDLDPSDLSQIEVLKGPQGTLYGAGAVGGLLKFTTISPNLRDFQYSGSAGINSVDHGEAGYALRGSINIPFITDQVAFHVSGFFRRDGGYVDNVNTRIGSSDINRADVRGGRAVLSVHLGPQFRLDLSGMGQDITTHGSNIVDVDAVTLRPLRGDLTQNRPSPEEGRVRLRLYNATLRGDVGAVNLVSSTTYQRIFYQEIADASQTYGPIFAAQSGNPGLGVSLNTIKRTERWSEEARASTTDLFGGVLDLQAGFYWTHEDDENRIPGATSFLQSTGAVIPQLTLPVLALFGLPTTSPYGIVNARIDSTYEEVSFFGNARLHIGQKFDVLAGLRYSHDHQTFLQDYRGLLIPLLTGGQATVIAPGTESHNVATWLVSPRYRFSPHFMIYARIASGYRPGGPNPAPPFGNIPSTFQPDRLVQYEVGFKGSTLDHMLTIDAAAFYTDWNDIQIQTSANGFNFLVNGGSARSQGGELTVRFRPTSGLTFGLNAAYTDAKLSSAAPAAGGLQGDRLPYVPHLSGSMTADYLVPIGERHLNVGATLNYVGSRTSDYTNRFPKRLGDYATIDLRAGMDFGRFTISAFARNLTDNRAIVVVGTEGLAPNNTPGAAYGAGILQPRTIGAEVAVHF